MRSDSLLGMLPPGSSYLVPLHTAPTKKASTQSHTSISGGRSTLQASLLHIRAIRSETVKASYLSYATGGYVLNATSAFHPSGNRFQVIVQYAPFQKIPPKKVKPDPLSGTIDDG